MFLHEFECAGNVASAHLYSSICKTNIIGNNKLVGMGIVIWWIFFYFYGILLLWFFTFERLLHLTSNFMLQLPQLCMSRLQGQKFFT